MYIQLKWGQACGPPKIRAHTAGHIEVAQCGIAMRATADTLCQYVCWQVGLVPQTPHTSQDQGVIHRPHAVYNATTTTQTNWNLTLSDTSEAWDARDEWDTSAAYRIRRRNACIASELQCKRAAGNVNVLSYAGSYSGLLALTPA